MSARATAATRSRRERMEEERERGQRHDLREHQEDRHPDRLAEPDRAAVARREHEPVQHALLALGREDAGQPEQRGEHDRDPEQPRLGPLGRARQAARSGRSSARRRRRAASPAACPASAPRAAGPSARAPRRLRQYAFMPARGGPCERAASASGSCVATSAVTEARSASSAWSSSAPSASRPSKGSSRSRRSGSWRNARQSASRWSIPRENVPARSFRAPRARSARAAPVTLAALGEPVQAPVQVEILERRQLAVDERLVPEEPDRAARGFHLERAVRGRQQPRERRSKVVFPDPFGPVTRTKPPAGTTRSSALQNAFLPEALRQLSAL